MPPIIISGSSPELAQITGVPAVHILTPTLSRPVITTLFGWPLPIHFAGALEHAGAYLIVRREHGAAPAVYVGEAGSIEQRLAGHHRLQWNSGSISVIAITAEAGDLTKPDARTLERLLYLGLVAEPGIELCNANEPAHSTVDQVRFEKLCAFAVDALTRIAETSLLPLSGRWRDALSGMGMCAELVSMPPLQVLIGAQRKHLRGNGYKAEALFLQDGRCLLRAGSLIRAVAALKIPTRAAIHRQEAIYAGLVIDQEGTLTVIRDLLFASSKRITCFVTGSTTGLWKKDAETRAEPRTSFRLSLSLWRDMAPRDCSVQDAERLRSLLADTELFGEPAWPRARSGDVKAATAVALRVTNPLRSEPSGIGALDLAMTAMLACAIDGGSAAAEVFDMLLFRLAGKGFAISAPTRMRF